MPAAAILAGVAVLVPGVSDEVSASTPQPLAKGDRLDAKPVGTRLLPARLAAFRDRLPCATLNSPTRQAKAVRVVTVDRLEASRTVMPERSLAMR